MYGASEPGLLLSHQPPKDPQGGRQPAYPRYQSTLRSPAGVSCTSSSRPWRCQSVWSDSSRYCRTIPETGSWEPWGQHRKLELKERIRKQGLAKAATILCRLLPSRRRAFFSAPWIWAGPVTCSDHRDWWKQCCASPEPAASSLAAPGRPATLCHVNKPKIAFGMTRDTRPDHPSCPSQ